MSNALLAPLRLIRSAVFGMTAVACCSSAVRPQVRKIALDADDLAVLRVVIQSTIVHELHNHPRQVGVLLADLTAPVCNPGDPGDRERCRDPLARQVMYPLPDLGLASTRLVSHQWLGIVRRPDEMWRRVDETFGTGWHAVAQVSAPVYDHGAADVWATYWCGGACGYGWLVHVVKRAAIWEWGGQRVVWIS